MSTYANDKKYVFKERVKNEQISFIYFIISDLSFVYPFLLRKEFAPTLSSDIHKGQGKISEFWTKFSGFIVGF